MRHRQYVIFRARLDYQKIVQMGYFALRVPLAATRIPFTVVLRGRKQRLRVPYLARVV